MISQSISDSFSGLTIQPVCIASIHAVQTLRFSLASLQLELSAWTKTSADMENMCHNQHPLGLIYLDNIIGKTNKHCNIVVFSKRGEKVTLFYPTIIAY
jgi:hypothetical protein